MDSEKIGAYFALIAMSDNEAVRAVCEALGIDSEDCRNAAIEMKLHTDRETLAGLMEEVGY